MAKPLDQFYKDCLRVGSLKCFMHFHLYLKVINLYQEVNFCNISCMRTRDMLKGIILSMFHHDSGEGGARCHCLFRGRALSSNSSDLQGHPITRVRVDHVNSHTQSVDMSMHCLPMSTCRNAFPPASPAAHELDVHNPEVIVFLIGAYAKYNWPYVWLRSLTRSYTVEDIDSPLDLPSTKNWKALGKTQDEMRVD